MTGDGICNRKSYVERSTLGVRAITDPDGSAAIALLAGSSYGIQHK